MLANCTVELETAQRGEAAGDVPGEARQRALSDNEAAPERVVVRVVVIVEPACANRHEVAGFPALARIEQADLVDLGAVGVIRVGIGRHVVRSGVVVDE